MPAIIVKNYNHVNKAFANWDTKEGVLVKNKDHYDRLMKQNNMISYEESMERNKNNGKKPYVISKKALDIIKTVKNSADKHGKLKLSDRTIDAMVKMGAMGKKIPDYMKISGLNSEKGGFSLTEEQKKVYDEE